MQHDPIVEEVQKVRQAYARSFGFDLRTMADDLRRHEREHAERLVSYPAKPARKKKEA
jgi:hypothetical protein